jgi:hypothetical protein
MLRAFGALALFMFGFVLSAGALALSTGGAFPQMLIAAGQPVDPTHWAFHWRVQGSTALVLGLVGAVGGFATLRGRLKGLRLILAASFGLLAADLVKRATGFSIYEYEFESAAALATLACTAAVSLAWIVLGHRRSTGSPNNQLE